MKSVKRLISLALSLVLVFFIFPVHKTEAEEPHIVFAYSISNDTATAVATGLNSGLNYESHEGQGWGLLTGAGLGIISDYGDQLSRCYLHHLNPGNNSMQCMFGDLTYDEAMSKWNAYLQSSIVQGNLGNIVGFALSDDWYYSPGAGKKLFQDMTASLHTYAPGHKSICIMTANTSYAKSPQSYSHFAAAMNFSPQGCDMVGIYLYPTVNHLPVSNYSNAVLGLELLGLDPKVTPVLGIAEDYNTTGAAVENEVKYMCDNGAWGIGFWAYNVRYGSTDGSRSADIRGGMSRGIQYCGGLWGEGSLGSLGPQPGGSGSSFTNYPYSEDSSLPDLLPPDGLVPGVAPDELQVNPIFPTPSDAPASAIEACTTGDAAKNTAGLIPCGKNTNDPATPWNECDPCNLCSMVRMGQLTTEFLVKMAAIVATLAIILAGLVYVFATGKQETLNKAKFIMKNALIGFAVIFIAWIIVDGILTTMGYIDPIEGQWYAMC